jgi:hypothetical protein
MCSREIGAKSRSRSHAKPRNPRRCLPGYFISPARAPRVLLREAARPAALARLRARPRPSSFPSRHSLDGLLRNELRLAEPVDCKLGFVSNFRRLAAYPLRRSDDRLAYAPRAPSVSAMVAATSPQRRSTDMKLVARRPRNASPATARSNFRFAPDSGERGANDL